MHYSLAAITEKPEDYKYLLMPFDENLHTDVYLYKTFRQLIDEARDEFKKAKQNKQNNPSYYDYLKKTYNYSNDSDLFASIKKLYETPDRKEYYFFTENGDLYSTYNKAALYDWYTVGGRYSDILKLKKGKSGILTTEFSLFNWLNDTHLDECSQAQIKDVDFMATCEVDPAQLEYAANFWDLFVEDMPAPKEEKEKYEHIIKREWYLDTYHDKATYLRHCTSFPVYALIANGEVIAPPEDELFEFARKNDTELTYKDYLDQKDSIIKNLNPEHYITILDCHI